MREIVEPPKFNMGIASLQRLDFLLQRSNNASSIDDFDLWYRSLFAIHREIKPLMKDEERKTAKGFKSKSSQLISYYKNKKLKTNTSDVVNSLEDYEDILKEVMHKNNLIFPKGDMDLF